MQEEMSQKQVEKLLESKQLKIKKKRTFGGNFDLITARKNTSETQFEKKHLKAYLQGKSCF